MPKLGQFISKSCLPFLIIILGFSFFSWKSLLNPGFFEVHDYQQVARLYEMDKALNDGQFPVRWVSDLGFGYGYPLFNFYPPLAYYTGEIIHKIGGVDFVDSIKIVYFLALILSGFSMFFLARELFGSWGGLLGALFYIYAPYRAVDIYVRGALAESFAFVWLPLALLFGYKLAKNWSQTSFLGLALASAALMLSHQLIYLAFVPFLIFWTGALIYITKQKPLKIFLLFGFSLILGLGLSGFFWLPAILEKSYTLVDKISTQNLNSYLIHFVCPSQLWNSPWGYGGSVKGCLDGLSFQVGKLHLLLAGLSLFLTGYWFFKKKFTLFFILLLGQILLLFSLLMTSSYSQIIWDHFTPLSFLQFPWRFLTIIALFVSLLAGAICLPLKNKLTQILIVLLAGTLVVAVNAKHFVPKLYYSPAKNFAMTQTDNIKWEASLNAFEYLPSGIATRMAPNGDIVVDIDKNSISKQTFSVNTQEVKIENSGVSSNRFWLSGDFQKPSTVTFTVTNFPGWTVKVDSRKVLVNDQNKYKLISLKIPAGRHEVTGHFEDTPIRKIGNTLTLVSLLFILGGLLYGIRTNKN